MIVFAFAFFTSSIISGNSCAALTNAQEKKAQKKKKEWKATAPSGGSGQVNNRIRRLSKIWQHFSRLLIVFQLYNFESKFGSHYAFDLHSRCVEPKQGEGKEDFRLEIDACNKYAIKCEANDLGRV